MKNFFLVRWLNNVSIARKLYFTVGIMALLIIVELGSLLFAISTLSAVRAYVGGEGLWSKAQKDALYHLQRYTYTHYESAYHEFLKNMNVPAGDHKARIKMLKENPDLNVVRQGFLEGRIHADDIDGIIKLFRRFHTNYYISNAISIWTEADSVIAELIPLASQIHAEVSTGNPSDEKVNAILDEVVLINSRLTVLEDNFSFTLGEGSRWMEDLILKILFAIALTVEISGLLLTFFVSRSIAGGVNEIVRASEQIASGDFNARAKIFSLDEIGTLANSFNRMADDLEAEKIDQQRIEEDLKAQKELYETLLNAQSEMGEGVAITEGNKIVYANAALAKLYGYSMEEILSLPSFLDIVVEEDKARLAERFNQRLSGENVADTGETSVVRKDGQIINIEYSLKKIRIGNRTQTVSIIRDISEKIKAQYTATLRAEELKRINQELEQFAYVTSHDLQEPLRSITSYLQLIERRYKNKLDAEADQFIHYAVDGATRMSLLIKDLLTYSRIGTHSAPFEKVDCATVVNTAIDNLYNTIYENKALIKIDTPLPVLNADPLQMTLLFQNLFSNAIKFKNTKTPEVHLAAEDHKNYWKFSVKDNGIGISKEYEERVFVIFQRLHTRDEYPGSGIGLSVCKKIVERHGGKIWLESNNGQGGTTFYFTINKNVAAKGEIES